MSYAMVIKASGEARMVEFPTEDKLDWYYETIGCDCIDIVNPYQIEKIGKENGLKSLVGKFCIIVDDEGLLKEEPKINVIASLLYGYDSHGQGLFGDVIIAQNKETDDGIETVGLEPNDMMLLQTAINGVIEEHNKGREQKNG